MDMFGNMAEQLLRLPDEISENVEEYANRVTVAVEELQKANNQLVVEATQFKQEVDRLSKEHAQRQQELEEEKNKTRNALLKADQEGHRYDQAMSTFHNYQQQLAQADTDKQLRIQEPETKLSDAEQQPESTRSQLQSVQAASGDASAQAIQIAKIEAKQEVERNIKVIHDNKQQELESLRNDLESRIDKLQNDADQSAIEHGKALNEITIHKARIDELLLGRHEP